MSDPPTTQWFPRIRLCVALALIVVALCFSVAFVAHGNDCTTRTTTVTDKSQTMQSIHVTTTESCPTGARSDGWTAAAVAVVGILVLLTVDFNLIEASGMGFRVRAKKSQTAGSVANAFNAEDDASGG